MIMMNSVEKKKSTTAKVRIGIINAVEKNTNNRLNKTTG
jgi:hypothetical protein